jgi:hypothetical protein
MTPLEESTALCSQFTTVITTFFFQFRVSEMYLDGAVKREGNKKRKKMQLVV